VVPFGDGPALTAALHTALQTALHHGWDRPTIRAHAEANDWEGRVDVLEAEFRALFRAKPLPQGACAGPSAPRRP